MSHEQGAAKPRRLIAEDLPGEQVEGYDEQDDATARERDRRVLPRGRAFAADQAARQDEAQRVEWVIDGAHEPVAPGAPIEPLGLADVPQTVGEAGLGVPQRPAQQEGRAEHQEADPCGMLVEGHEGLSMAGKSSPRDPSRMLASWGARDPVGIETELYPNR